MQIVQKLVVSYDCLIKLLTTSFKDLFLLVSRLYISSIFFQSGWLKFENLLKGEWGHTLFLFREVHPVPFLPAEIAAVLGTAAEVVFPAVLAVGMFARLGALGLLGVTATITFGVHTHFTHVFWAFLLGVSVLFGPGKLSVDYWLRHWWDRRGI